ncbi:MAG: 2-dehydropantoate 2-reductase, partial [Granulosicoccus sp.]
MKIVIVGVGAMGSIYAGLFADAGHEVWAMDLWKEHTDAIAKQGLRVEGASGDRVVKGIQIAATAEQIGSCD